MLKETTPQEVPDIKCGDKVKHNNGTPIGKLKTSNSKRIDMVYIEGGIFRMGSKRITVSSFYIGKYPITQKQWTEVMDYNPSYFKGNNKPVECVTWYQAIEFCNKLSQKEGLTPVYHINGRNIVRNRSANGYELLTEARWEYAARGGNKSKGFTYSGSNNIGEVAWYKSNSGRKVQPVGTRMANELGIYDMSGNVREWCWDAFRGWDDSSSSVLEKNLYDSSSGSCRVLRGGNWFNNAEYCRSTYRNINYPDYGDHGSGFRITINELEGKC